jgi:hypothetical protein
MIQKKYKKWLSTYENLVFKKVLEFEKSLPDIFDNTKIKQICLSKQIIFL